MTVTVRPLPENLALALLVFSMIIEVINATVPLVLVVGDIDMTPTIVVGTTAVPRAITFFLASLYLAPGLAWWTQWRKIDRLLVCMIGSEIAYIFTIQARGSIMTPVVPLSNPWFILDYVSHFFVLYGLCGHIRSMCKWFKWTKKSVFCYKLVRFYHATLFIVTQLMTSGLASGQNSAINAAIAYFSVTMVLLHQLFAAVIIVERNLRAKLAEQEAASENNSENASLLKHVQNGDVIIK